MYEVYEQNGEVYTEGMTLWSCTINAGEWLGFGQEKQAVYNLLEQYNWVPDEGDYKRVRLIRQGIPPITE